MQLHVKDPSWKMELLEKLIEKLYHPAKSMLLAELDNMLVEHRMYRKIPATAAVHAYFEGQNYTLPADIPGMDFNKYVELDPKFHKNMSDIKEDYMDLSKESDELKTFFRRMLNECVTEADVECILPKSFFKAPLTTGMTMTPPQIKRFRRENLYHIELIKKRMVENLLMK